MVNVDALRAGLAAVEAAAKRHEWDQRVWRCESGMCFAGWVAQINGGRWVTQDLDGQWSDWLHAGLEDDPARVVSSADGIQAVTARYRAMRILGLSQDEATMLFSSENDLPALRRTVAWLIENNAPSSTEDGAQ